MASCVWEIFSEICGKNIGADFESVARWWVSKKRNLVLKCSCASLLWTISNLQNGVCFQGKKWRSVEEVLYKCARMMRIWKVLLKPDKLMELERLIEALEKRGAGPARIAWSSSTTTQESSSGASPSLRFLVGSRVAAEAGVGEAVRDIASCHVSPMNTYVVLSVENILYSLE